jgi:broad specificity phosphatase PhoE
VVTTLYLIRHGAVEGGGAKRYNGSIDVPLSEAGVHQIEAAAAFISAHLGNSALSKHMSYLKDIHAEEKNQGSGDEEGKTPALSAVYCSDLGRAVRSAEIIAAPFKLTPVIVPGLRERSFGIWEGMTFNDIKESYPKEFGLWAENPLKYSPPDGEDTSDVRDRAIGSFDAIIKKHDGDYIAVVAHGGINRIILCHVLGVPLEHIFRIEQDYAAVNIIEFWEKYPVVKLLNGRPCEKL